MYVRRQKGLQPSEHIILIQFSIATAISFVKRDLYIVGGSVLCSRRYWCTLTRYKKYKYINEKGVIVQIVISGIYLQCCT